MESCSLMCCVGVRLPRHMTGLGCRLQWPKSQSKLNFRCGRVCGESRCWMYPSCKHVTAWHIPVLHIEASVMCYLRATSLLSTRIWLLFPQMIHVLYPWECLCRPNVHYTYCTWTQTWVLWMEIRDSAPVCLLWRSTSDSGISHLSYCFSWVLHSPPQALICFMKNSETWAVHV